MNAVRLFALSGLFSYRALFAFLHPAVFIPTMLVVPVFQILLFAYIGRSAGVESDEFYVIGNAIHIASLPGIWAMAHVISGERLQRTLGYLITSPASRAPVFLGRALPVIANGFLVSLFALLAGGAVLSVTFPAATLASMAVVTAVAAFACTGLGLILGAAGLLVREIAVLNNLVFGFLLVLTGANVPVELLPDWIAAISGCLPLTHAIEAARQLAKGATLGDVDGALAAEALIGAIYCTAGFALLRSCEALSRRGATLEVA